MNKSSRTSRGGVLQLKTIKKILDDEGLLYEVTEHEAVFTNEQLAEAMGVELKSTVKTLVLKSQEGKFIVGIVRGDTRIDFKKLAKIIESKKMRLATSKEVLAITQCQVGSVHPYVRLNKRSTYLDKSILENTKVTFNPGLHTVSIQMDVKDMVNTIKPKIESFSSLI